MTPYDLFELAKDRNGNIPKETIIDIVNTLDLIRTDPDKYTYELEKYLNQLAEEYNCCPICGEELGVEESYEGSEYQGSPVREPIGEKYCPNHGYID